MRQLEFLSRLKKNPKNLLSAKIILKTLGHAAFLLPTVLLYSEVTTYFEDDRKNITVIFLPGPETGKHF